MGVIIIDPAPGTGHDFPPGWQQVASGNAFDGIDAANLAPGVNYRMTFTFPSFIPDWVFGNLFNSVRGLPGVQAVTQLGNEITVYFRT